MESLYVQKLDACGDAFLPSPGRRLTLCVLVRGVLQREGTQLEWQGMSRDLRRPGTARGSREERQTKTGRKGGGVLCWHDHQLASSSGCHANTSLTPAHDPQLASSSGGHTNASLTVEME
ncbi:hypothetical protein ACOMHN_005394 [Nucella lapillus]